MISYIVSSCDRPDLLACCLASLRVQQRRETLVCDNSTDFTMRGQVEYQCRQFGAIYIPTWKGKDSKICYHDPRSLKATGDWFCFPSDDSYYVPLFSQIMLGTAERNGWEFIYCDMVYDPRHAHATRGVHDEYSVMITHPSCGSIDKTCYLVTRRAFDQVGGWPSHEADWRDGALAEALVSAGIKHGRVPGPMVVHN